MLGRVNLMGRVKEMLFTAAPMESASPDELPGYDVYYGTVYGPSMTRKEELELKHYLEHVLSQVQYSVRVLGMQPVELEDVEIVPSVPSRQASVYYGPPSVFKRFGLERLESYSQYNLESRSNLRKVEAELERKELQNQKLVEEFERMSSDLKLRATVAEKNNRCTPEFAKDIEQLVECTSRNMKKILETGGSLLTLGGLLNRYKWLEKPVSWYDGAIHYGSNSLWAATLAVRAANAVGTSPVHFSAFSKETDSILNTDFTFDKLKLNSDQYLNMSSGFGVQFGANSAAGHLLCKLKNEHNSISLNFKSLVQADPAPGVAVNPPADVDADIFSTKISLNKPLGSNLKCVLDVPFPSLNGKIQVRGALFPCLVGSGSFKFQPNPGGPQLPRVPVIDLSGVFGIKYGGLGCHFQLKGGQPSFTAGMAVRTELMALGLTYQCPGSIYSMTLCKEVVDRAMTIAAKARYARHPAEGVAPVPGVNPGLTYAIGVKYAINPTMYCKAKVGSEGAAFLVKKSSSDGMFSVKGAVHVDFIEPNRDSKIGVVFSFRR